ncbi:amidase [Enterovirga rhinocerotis]|uniref:Amidase n=1 Tax=Enterovirga rhinocerotis TaxID=1339210 RepID=A0A4R7BYM8_9HYPH|nr:amidase [Enterovirga rhinocerotis]TDR89136.1 amidase [Enterovirga rhinocerotis]
MLLRDDPARAFMPYPAVEVPGAASGPLAGLTFAAKDLFDVAGYPTGGGSPAVLARSGIKTQTAPAVQRLLDAGARFVGKTHTDEFAFSMNGKNAHFGTPVNGGAPDRIPGGSSSGSASAVSNGLCDTALGTDTGGSVRAPASHCGLFGLRPSHGRISLEGCLDLAPSFDTCGFFARSGDVFERVAAVMLGEDSAPLPEQPRLVLAADAFAMLDTEVRAVLAPLVQGIEAQLGAAQMVDAAGPSGFEPLYWAFRYLQGREAWLADGDVISTHRMPLGPGVAERFAFSRTVSDAQVESADGCRADFRERFRTIVPEGTVMVLPTVPDVAPLLTDDESTLESYRNRSLNLLSLSGLSGAPQVSMPVAGRLGAPFGLSLIGPVGSDLGLVRLAARLAANL